MLVAQTVRPCALTFEMMPTRTFLLFAAITESLIMSALQFEIDTFGSAVPAFRQLLVSMKTRSPAAMV
ncbi:hypothetical protein DDJ40_01795 [Mycobacteroides abscessus]|nr:hypothetical protein DDJ40_01795 [Mycobacteroides abscessus]